MKFPTTLALLASCVLARPADQDPLQFINTLFHQADATPSISPFSICQPAKTFDPSLGPQFAMCSISWQPFSMTPNKVRDLWAKVKVANDASVTTINSRRGDYSVEQFDGVSDTATYYTIEHGAACRSKAVTNNKCLMVLVHRQFV